MPWLRPRPSIRPPRRGRENEQTAEANREQQTRQRGDEETSRRRFQPVRDYSRRRRCAWRRLHEPFGKGNSSDFVQQPLIEFSRAKTRPNVNGALSVTLM